MEKKPKPREPHYVRQFRQWSTEFGEKDDLSNCRKRLSRPVLRARLSTSGLRELQPTNAIQRGLQTRINEVTNDLMQARSYSFLTSVALYRCPFWPCCCSG